MAELGELIVRLGADTRAIRKGLDRAENRMDKFGGAVKRLGIQLIGAFGAVQIVRSIVSTANAFDEARRVIVRSTGATGDALGRLDRQFRNVLGRVPEDAAKVATVFARLSSQTDATGETLQQLTRDILGASRVMGEDAVQTTTLFSRVLQQWQVPAERASGLLNQLFVLSQRYGVGLSQLNNLVVEYGAVLTNAGFSLLETAELQARLTQAGINWTRVSPGINAAFRTWAAEGKNLREELGLTITKIKTAATETQALAIATGVFGAEGAARLTLAIRQGVFAIDDLGEGLENLRDEIEKTVRATETLGDRWSRFTNRVALQATGFEASFSDVFKAMIDVVQAWFTFLTGRADIVFDFLGQKLEVFKLKFQRLFTFSPGALADLDATIAEAEKKLDAFAAKVLREIDIFPELKAPEIDLGVKQIEVQVKQIAVTATKWTGIGIRGAKALFKAWQELQKGLGEDVVAASKIEQAIRDRTERETKALQERIRSELDFTGQLTRDLAADFASDEKKKILAIEATARIRRAAVEDEITNERLKAALIGDINRAEEAAKRQLVRDTFSAGVDLAKRFEILAETGLNRRLAQIAEEEQARKLQAIRIIKDVELREVTIRNIERAAQNERLAAARQFPTFWAQQNQLMVESFTQAMGMIRVQFGATVAGLIQGTTTWRDFFTQVTNQLLNTFTQLLLQLLAKWIANRAIDTEVFRATETAKTAILGEAEVARAAIGVLATEAMLAGMGATLTAAGAMASAMIVMMEAVGQMAAVILFMIGVAMASNPFTAAFSAPTIKAATALSFGVASAGIAAAGTVTAALVAGVAALTAGAAGAVALAHGGIVTQPTLALLGEAGPELVLPRNRAGGFGFGGGAPDVHVHVYLNRRELAHEFLQELPRLVRMKLGNAI